MGYVSYPDIRWDLWGGVPSFLRPVYVVTMLLAAVGFFTFTWYILFRLEPASTRIAGRFHYGFFLVAYAAVLFASAAWMPLTLLTMARPTVFLWVSVRSVLALVALASLALLWALFRLNVKEPALSYRLAVAGCLLFCAQTVVLDALIWPAYFPH